MTALIQQTARLTEANERLTRLEQQGAVTTAATTTRSQTQAQEQSVPKPKVEINLPNKNLNRDEYQDLTLWDLPLNELGARETNPSWS